MTDNQNACFLRIDEGGAITLPSNVRVALDWNEGTTLLCRVGEGGVLRLVKVADPDWSR
jgi:bifunctional DNA-binding transcriptional regulator/antitoxin component of YhaV-PrlF toxin-antitoxin module